jgi:hypothetical protein
LFPIIVQRENELFPGGFDGRKSLADVIVFSLDDYSFTRYDAYFATMIAESTFVCIAALDANFICCCCCCFFFLSVTPVQDPQSIPKGRQGHSANLVGDKLVVFGGWVDGTGISNEIFLFDVGEYHSRFSNAI